MNQRPAYENEGWSLFRSVKIEFEKTKLAPVTGAVPPQFAAVLKFVEEGVVDHVLVAAFVLADPRSPAVTKSAKVVLARVGRVVFMGGVWLGGELGGLVLGKRVWEILKSGLGEFFGVSALCLQR